MIVKMILFLEAKVIKVMRCVLLLLVKKLLPNIIWQFNNKFKDKEFKITISQINLKIKVSNYSTYFQGYSK